MSLWELSCFILRVGNFEGRLTHETVLLQPFLRLQRKMWIFLPFLVCSWLGLAQDIEDASVRVRGTSIIAETDDNFICATLDWWPPDKCNYGNCPWGEASVFNLVIIVDHFFLFDVQLN